MKLREMYTLEELKKGVRNPLYHRFCRDVTVGVTHEDYEFFEKIAELKGARIESIIQWAISKALKWHMEMEDEPEYIKKGMVLSMDRKFEWDEDKNRENIKKHDVSFEDARAVFWDTRAVTLYDEEHSEDEDRFKIIGRNLNFLHELTVCHCYRGADEDIVRIISARGATKSEIEIYKRGY